MDRPFNKLCILWLCTCSDMVAVTNHDLFFVQDSYCIYVIVNKWIAGGRIFNVFNAVKNKHISIKRIPGIRRIRKNDILIFNSPVGQYKNRIHFDVMQYYAKRCVGLPGDTVAIILPTLSALVEDSLTFSFDHNYYDVLGWTA